MNIKKLAAELIGAFMWVAAVLGAAVFSAGAGANGIALSVCFTVMASSYAFGHISGGHFNPAVTLGLWAAGKFETGSIGGYVAAQCAGAIVAAALFLLIGSTKAGFNPDIFAANTFQPIGPYPMSSVFLMELVLTAFLVVVFVGTTSRKVPAGFAPLAIGLALAGLHIIALPVSNASLNPARSIATALFATKAGVLGQAWLFILAPIVGGILGGFLGRWLQEE